MKEKKARIVELDMLRILSCLIVVVMIHLPNNYAYNFYIELNSLTRFRLHTFGIYCAMGSFVFISGFNLMRKALSEGGKKRHETKNFVLGRFKRIFPLYWIALVVFLFLFELILLF